MINCTGHTQSGSMIADGYAGGFKQYYSTGTINITDGTYTCTTKGGCGVKSIGNGTINIDGATFSTAGNDSHGVYVLGGATINIESANIDTQHIDSTQGNENMAGYVVYISSMEAGSGKVTIKSGNYKGHVMSDAYGYVNQVVKIDAGCTGYISIEGGNFNAEPKVRGYNGSIYAEVIASGYHAVENNDNTWTVVAK